MRSYASASPGFAGSSAASAARDAGVFLEIGVDEILGRVVDLIELERQVEPVFEKSLELRDCVIAVLPLLRRAARLHGRHRGRPAQGTGRGSEAVGLPPAGSKCRHGGRGESAGSVQLAGPARWMPVRWMPHRPPRRVYAPPHHRPMTRSGQASTGIRTSGPSGWSGVRPDQGERACLGAEGGFEPPTKGL